MFGKIMLSALLAITLLSANEGYAGDALGIIRKADKIMLPLVLDEKSLPKLSEGRPMLSLPDQAALQLSSMKLSDGNPVLLSDSNVQLLGKVELAKGVNTLIIAQATEGDQSMYLLNFSHQGRLLATERGFYNDLAEGYSWEDSRLKTGLVTLNVNSILVNGKMLEKAYEQNRFEIRVGKDGLFLRKKISSSIKKTEN